MCYGTVKGDGFFEHAVHVGDAAYVPSVEVLVEGITTGEHAQHVGDATHVPSGDVLVELAIFEEHAVHVGDVTYVPSADVLIEPSGTAQDVLHIGHVGDTHLGEVALCSHNGQESSTVHHFNGIAVHQEEVTYVQTVTLDAGICIDMKN